MSGLEVKHARRHHYTELIILLAALYLLATVLTGHQEDINLVCIFVSVIVLVLACRFIFNITHSWAVRKLESKPKCPRHRNAAMICLYHSSLFSTSICYCIGFIND